MTFEDCNLRPNKKKNGPNSLKFTLNSLDSFWARPGARRAQFKVERLRDEPRKAANVSHFCCEEDCVTSPESPFGCADQKSCGEPGKVVYSISG